MKLEASGISFRYQKGNREILNNVSLEIDSSERVGLIAPSGFGNQKPDQGMVLLDGKPLEAFRGYCPVQMIWQHPELSVNPRLKMKEVLREGDRIPERIVEGLGIEKDWLNRYPAELSGGELQRFCIARALGEKTKFLLADEISTMLDLITQSQIWNFLIREVSEREIGLLVVSHSEPLLEKLCSRIINLWEEG